MVMNTGICGNNANFATETIQKTHKDRPMNLLSTPSAAFADTKPHYEILDGLRGVAALLVLMYHVCEGYAFASGADTIDSINHGYLAVDFFFMLSGFVIGYAYDDRWGKTLTTGNYIKRRLIRLHPMVIMGAIIGLIFFLLQGSVTWEGEHVSLTRALVALVCAMLFIPAVRGGYYEVRGNGEAFPLNGPAWSLFFEYIGNLIYAFFIRRFPTWLVGVLAGVLGAGLCAMTWLNLCGGDMLGVGWTMSNYGLLTGGLRMLFPFTVGLLISRLTHPKATRHTFWPCSLLLIAVFLVPYIPSEGGISMNGLFESLAVAIVFPAVVWLGAHGTVTGKWTSRVCKFLGDISFPVYIIHYPLMYYFYAWMMEKQAYTFADTWPVSIGVVVVNIVLAWVLLKVYDEPVRHWLTQRLIRKTD